jgi:hypothetical protein
LLRVEGLLTVAELGRDKSLIVDRPTLTSAL